MYWCQHLLCLNDIIIFASQPSTNYLIARFVFVDLDDILMNKVWKKFIIIINIMIIMIVIDIIIIIIVITIVCERYMYVSFSFIFKNGLKFKGSKLIHFYINLVTDQ